MQRIIATFALPLFLLASNALGAEVSQFVPTLKPPIPVFEQLLNGDVALVVSSQEYAGQEAAPRNVSVWEKVPMHDAASSTGMTFLMPRSVLRQNPEPYYHITDPTGETYTCLLTPLAEMGGTTHFHVLKYDARGRIRDMNLLELGWNSTGSGFRYVFEYGDEEDCQAVRIFFRRDEAYVHGDKTIAPGEDVAVGLIEFQYEDGELKKFFNKDSNYFFHPSEHELTYDEQGFLASEAEFDGVNTQKLTYAWHYRNYEQDRFGNWTRRDLYRDEQHVGTYRREIYYVGDALPDMPENPVDAEDTAEPWPVRKMDFHSSIHWLLSHAYTFCVYEFFHGTTANAATD